MLLYPLTVCFYNCLISLQQKHQVVEREINGRQQHFQSVCQNGEKVKLEAVHASKAIGLRIVTLQERWKKLNELCANRKQRLEEGIQQQQVCTYMCACIIVCVHAYVCVSVCLSLCMIVHMQ